MAEQAAKLLQAVLPWVPVRNGVVTVPPPSCLRPGAVEGASLAL